MQIRTGAGRRATIQRVSMHAAYLTAVPSELHCATGILQRAHQEAKANRFERAGFDGEEHMTMTHQWQRKSGIPS